MLRLFALLRWGAVSVILGGTLSFCTMEKMALHYIEVSDGIQPAHQSQSPVLEQVLCAPEKDGCETSRIYPDGSLYFLVSPSDSIPDPLWVRITRIKPTGVAEILALLERICAVAQEPTPQGGDQGSATYRIHTDHCERELLITGVPSGAFQDLAQLPTLINGNLLPLGE